MIIVMLETDKPKTKTKLRKAIDKIVFFLTTKRKKRRSSKLYIFN